MDFASRLGRAGDADELVELFSEAPDEGARSNVAGRALEVDLRTGVRLTLEFLRRDPPLFFRQVVVDKLEEVTGKPSGFNVEQPFSDPANRDAVAKLASEYELKVP